MRDDRPVHAERRMSDLEAMMWNLEKDPALSSTFGSLTILDRAPDFDRFLARMAYVVSAVPRLRQHVVAGLGRLAPPEWLEDPDFDLRYHVRRIGLPADATMDDLYALAARRVQDPFDRTRPLWTFLIIEGVPGGRAAMLQKMHHTITDGEGGIRMSERLVDLERDATDPAPLDHDASADAAPSNIFETTWDTMGHGARRTAGAIGRGVEWAGGSVTDPGRLVGAGLEVPRTLSSTARQLMITDPAHSPLWRTRTLKRWFGPFDVPFAAAKDAAAHLGGSLNDFFVAGAARAAGQYHAERDIDLDSLRMAMPVSFRSDGAAGGNAFAPMRVLVPTKAADVETHFRAVRSVLTATKQERAIGVVGAAAGLINVLPTSMLVRLTRNQVETIDFTTSNVRAAPFDLFIAGSRIEGNYPLGPLSGTAFNLTMMSYCGTLNMGLHVDHGAIDDPERLRDLLALAYEELIAAASSATSDPGAAAP